MTDILGVDSMILWRDWAEAMHDVYGLPKTITAMSFSRSDDMFMKLNIEMHIDADMLALPADSILENQEAED